MMNWNGVEYKPEVAWRTIIKEAVLIQVETTLVPAVYQVAVEPVDMTNPGASTSDKQINYNILDYLGHIYRITQINVGGNSKRVLVSDDFRWKQSPVNGKQAIVYKSVGGGFSPWLAATYGTHLARTAANTAAGIDNSILWKTSEKIEFTNTNTPSSLKQ
jgi:osmotically-inducible protein OsmY